MASFTKKFTESQKPFEKQKNRAMNINHKNALFHFQIYIILCRLNTDSE